MEDRTARVPSVKPKPAEVLLAAACFVPSNSRSRPTTTMSLHDRRKGTACSRRRPVHFKQQPGRSDLLEMADQRMHRAGAHRAGS